MIGQFPYVEEILVIEAFHQQMVQVKINKNKSFCTEYILLAMSQAACLGHILGSSVVSDTCKNYFDKEEITHWLNRMLNYAEETMEL